ncbi:MAG: hypothetical protein FJ297_12000 [Planctomycetes bacterium]|nr:hypothetical protein [Planctomycetota bacterium]
MFRAVTAGELIQQLLEQKHLFRALGQGDLVRRAKPTTPHSLAGSLSLPGSPPRLLAFFLLPHGERLFHLPGPALFPLQFLDPLQGRQEPPIQ